jgi:thioredoxin 1
MSDHITTLTNENFDSTINDAQTPVLVDFWAEYDGRLTIAKLNVDDHREATEKFNIRGIPTLILFKNGEPEATKVGALSKSQLAAFIDSNI